MFQMIDTSVLELLYNFITEENDMIFYNQHDHRTYLNESNAMQIVNEAYFGKTKEVLAIEQAVHDLRAPYIKDYDHTLNMDTYTPRINRDPNKQKLQEAICDAFGFSDALFQIILPHATQTKATVLSRADGNITLSRKNARASISR